jgi:hypothetical protein
MSIFIALGAITFAAAVYTFVVTARDDYRRIPTRDF